MRTDDVETSLTRTPLQILWEAERNFFDALRIFDDLINKIRAGKPVSRKETEKAVRAFHGAVVAFFVLRRAMDEQAEREDRLPKFHGLDLEEARDRVNRLLDRLRVSGSSEEVS